MRSAARPARANPLQWLLIAAAIQLALFIGFAGFYFGSEQKRHDELKDVQGELHHLRAENARQQKRLIHANKRMLKYEADIKAELRTASPYDADAADAAVEEGEEDVGMIEREPDDMMEGQPSADDAAGSNEVAHAHGSIAPAAHIQPVAAARRAPGANVSMRGHGDHGHPERASMPSAAASAAVAAALPPVLRGRCVQLTHEYWTYELCFGRRVRQFHKSAGGSEDEQISLGRYVAPKGAGHHGLLLQRYKGGDACASGTNRRSVEAKLVCADGSSDVSLVEASEPHTCHYLLIVHVPRANCGEVSGGTESIGAGGNGHEGGGENAERGDSAAHAAGILDAAKSTQGPVSSTASSAAAASLAPELALESLVALDSSGTAAVETKRNAVVHALRHAWRGYERYAFGADEVKPISKAQNNWIGQGLTILDALDVLWMAGLRSEYSKAAEWVHAHLDFSRNAKVSFFETTIRCLGGLLSAHELTGDAVFLQKASDLGERLGRAFGSGPGGMPHTAISLGSGEHSMPSWLAGNVLLAEVGTVQMEFASLASHSGQRQLREKADHVFDVLDREGPPLDANGGRLWPIHVRPDSGKPSGAVISWGAMGDSFYEYLLKYWLLTGKRHEQYRRMYLESTRALITRLIVVEGGLTYVAESKNGQLLRKMDQCAPPPSPPPLPITPPSPLAQHYYTCANVRAPTLGPLTLQLSVRSTGASRPS